MKLQGDASVEISAVRGAAAVIGALAPDFTLPNQFGEPIRLSGLRGSNVVLVFYPFAFSKVCSTEMCELAARSSDFEDAGAKLLAISVDSKYALRAYAAAEGLEFDLLSDFWPHGAVAETYGVFDVDRGMARRGSFAIDTEGVLRDAFSTENSQARPWADYQRALRTLRSSDD